MKGVYMKNITKEGILNETIEELKIVKEDVIYNFKITNFIATKK